MNENEYQKALAEDDTFSALIAVVRIEMMREIGIGLAGKDVSVPYVSRTVTGNPIEHTHGVVEALECVVLEPVPMAALVGVLGASSCPLVAKLRVAIQAAYADMFAEDVAEARFTSD